MATTVFVSEETSKIATKRNYTPLLKQILTRQDINEEQTIKSFLGKPVMIADGLFQSSDVVSTFGQFHVPGSIIGSTPLIQNKLSGFLGFKATTVFTLQVNANRFVQGRYLLNFYPLCGAYGTVEAARKLAIHQYSLMQRTQVPGIQIDLNCETQVVLKVPFVSAYPFYPMRALNTSVSARSIGAIQIHPYIATNVNVSYTLFAHFEDVELIGATIPQSTNSEQKSKDMGTVETNLRKLTISSNYAKKLPVIGSSIESVGWVADIMANVASVWGWSKPTQNTAPAPIFRHRGLQNQNIDGADVSAKISLSCKNEVATIDGLLGSNIDEMSFKYIQSIPAWYRTLTWNASDLKEVQLTSVGLHPLAFFSNSTDNGNGVQSWPPCSWPALNFVNYRGSFNLTLKLVKTEFHSGRLLVVFYPFIGDGGLATPSMTYAQTFYCHRHIIDIRYGNEWTFNFPFTADYLYKDIGSAYGNVYIYVENPLVAPPSVSSTINILIEVSGGEDLEYAVPRPYGVLPYFPNAPQASNGGQFACDKIEEIIGTARADEEDIITSALVVGEKITSYRQLLKRFELRVNRTSTTNDNFYYILPYTHGLVSGLGTAGSPTFPAVNADTIVRTGLCFALARGSIRTKLYDPKPANSGSCVAYSSQSFAAITYEYQSGSVASDGSTGASATFGKPTALITVNDGLTAELQLPMYSYSYAFPICDVMQFSGSPYQTRGPAPNQIINVTNLFTTGTRAPYYMRAIGDDFSYGYFISTIPLIAGGSNYDQTWV